MIQNTKIKNIIKMMPNFIPYSDSIRFIPIWSCTILKHKFRRKTPLDDKIPWITFKAKKWLESYLNCDMKVFEYGSGGSTIFIAKRVRKLISVEHNKEWHKLVFERIKNENINNCNYMLIEPDFINRKRQDFDNYVKSINSSPDEFFDLVFVDGRERVSCIRHSLNKIRPGGFLLLDNADRERYNAGKKMLSEWNQKNFYGIGPYSSVFWDTEIWCKPYKNNR